MLSAVTYIGFVAKQKLTEESCFKLQPFNLTMANFNGNKLEIPALDVDVKPECVEPFADAIKTSLLIGTACGVVIAAARIIYNINHKDNHNSQQEIESISQDYFQLSP
jgi:hypothetical protein